MYFRLTAFLAVLLTGSGLLMPAVCQEAGIRSQEITFSRLPGLLSYGRLEWRGGIELLSSDERFGGFSGLEVSAKGDRAVAVSDDGWWLETRLDYENGNLVGASGGTLSPLLSANGKRATSKRRRDAESVAAFDLRRLDGPLLVARERNVAVELYDFGRKGVRSRAKQVRLPANMARLRGNSAIEAIGRFPGGVHEGWLIAVAERNFDDQGRIRGWLWKGRESLEFSIERTGKFVVTDLAIAPDGSDVFLLERSFVVGGLPGMAIRRLAAPSIREGAHIVPETLFEGYQPLYAIDNMEGLAVHEREKDELRLTVISDDNFNRGIQRTLLLQFAFKR